jgi:hypothetical protein
MTWAEILNFHQSTFSKQPKTPEQVGHQNMPVGFVNAHSSCRREVQAERVGAQWQVRRRHRPVWSPAEERPDQSRDPLAQQNCAVRHRWRLQWVSSWHLSVPKYHDTKVYVGRGDQCSAWSKIHAERNEEQIDFGESLLPFSSESISDVENSCGHNILQFTRGNEAEEHGQSKFRVWSADRGAYWI